MGLKLLPVEDGDEDKLEIFDITSDVPWTPRACVVHPMHSSCCAKFDPSFDIHLKRSASNKGGIGSTTKFSCTTTALVKYPTVTRKGHYFAAKKFLRYKGLLIRNKRREKWNKS